MRFLADMGVSYSAVQHLRAAGHDAIHLRDLQMQSAPDSDVFALAAKDRRIILTFDLDFAEIAAMAGSVLPSVVIFRINDTRVAHLIGRLQTMLSHAAPALLAGAIVIVDDSRIRIRELPIG